MKPDYDIAIAGSGFAGSLMALVAKHLGFSVVLLEKTHHPRVVTGESSTPLCNLLLETLAQRYDLPWLKPFAKWGTWQQFHPEIACGLKRGFTFFHHRLGQIDYPEVKAVERQLLVAASPTDAIADTHWFRADFDHFLLQKALASGVDYLDRCEVRSGTRDNGEWTLTLKAETAEHTIRAGFIIDATGPRGFLHRLLQLQDVGFPSLPQTSALYTHFTGVADFSGKQAYTTGTPPYPPSRAALHHVFPGGWMWVLHFNNGWTSAGFAASPKIAEQFSFAEGEAAWVRLLKALPEVETQFAAAKNTLPFTYIPQLSYRSSAISGEGWVMLPSAAGFVDPLLSTGFPLTLLGILRLGEVLKSGWGMSTFQQELSGYARHTEGELLATADLLSALYANMDDFATFRTLSLLYFAAASYAETAHRLERPELAQTFLLHTHPVFGPGLRRFTAQARGASGPQRKLALQQEVLAFIQTFDVAGLTTRPADHCYPVRASDLLAGASKVNATQTEVEDLLRRSGFPGYAS